MRLTSLRLTRRTIGRFARCEDGVALVEFAMVLPMMLIVFAVIIEGSRMLIAYQSAISGVRDAARYLARVVPGDVCGPSGAGAGAVIAQTGRLTTIVGQSTSGGGAFPTSVTLNSVTPGLSCTAGTYRVNPAPVATVTADVTITLPFAGLFGLLGISLGPVNTTITDASRVFGT